MQAKPVLELFRNIFLRKLEDLEDPKERDYSCPSWPYLQAHQNGERQQINEFLNLLDPIFR